MDTVELEEGQLVGEDDEDELEEGEIVDSDTYPGGEVTEVEEVEDDDRGYMGRGPPSDSEETVYPLSSEESSKSRVSFTKSLTHSLEEAAVIGGNGVSLGYPEEEEETDTGRAGGEAQSSGFHERQREGGGEAGGCRGHGGDHGQEEIRRS